MGALADGANPVLGTRLQGTHHICVPWLWDERLKVTKEAFAIFSPRGSEQTYASHQNLLHVRRQDLF